MRLTRYTKMPSEGGIFDLGKALVVKAAGVTNAVAGGGTIVAAQFKNGPIFVDAAAAAVGITTPTAAQMTAAYPEVKSGTGFEWRLISNSGTNAVTITPGAGVTGLGSMAVTGSANFFFQKTSDTAWLLVR
jgi:hypothetical protein